MPKKFPPDFKRDVVRVARRGDLSQAEVAADFDSSVSSVRRWVHQADVDDGVVDGQRAANRTSSSSCVGTSAAWGWRTRSCAEPRPTSPPAASQNEEPPAGPGPGRLGHPRAADCEVLGHSGQAYYAWLAAPVSNRDLQDRRTR